MDAYIIAAGGFHAVSAAAIRSDTAKSSSRRLDRTSRTFSLLRGFSSRRSRRSRAPQNSATFLRAQARDRIFPPSFIRSSGSVRATLTRVEYEENGTRIYTDEVKSPITINIDIRDTRRRLITCDSRGGGSPPYTHIVNPPRRVVGRAPTRE